MTILFYPWAINQPFYFDITSQQIPCLHSPFSLPDFISPFIQPLHCIHTHCKTTVGAKKEVYLTTLRYQRRLYDVRLMLTYQDINTDNVVHNNTQRHHTKQIESPRESLTLKSVTQSLRV